MSSFEQRIFSRSSFFPDEIVELRQVCFTPARVFTPGKYIAGQLPDIAFELGLVDHLPPVKGKSEEVQPPNQPLRKRAEGESGEPG
ncbi:hypothetical protein [Leptolyngbya sp. FACHB-711]|uniref:hypothetical protein n=1 Tax=unclassified Leptolyngbya TaxID=2650499 RepID=UPI0016839C6F|nr:hypothetical protein [Leptolyngbya sp. FACHB-711]MBD1852509.1 hypothetical protein [Cyanobacteria bacterium FACHB-502]MBD2027918.1 hypothetical protein [Leptolyngbya sp. FACHB-711]